MSKVSCLSCGAKFTANKTQICPKCVPGAVGLKKSVLRGDGAKAAVRTYKNENKRTG